MCLAAWSPPTVLASRINVRLFDLQQLTLVAGELSALNAIAGSMTEQVKVIHVVGQTPRPMQENRLMIHHSIGFNPDHQIFNKASEGFRVAAAELWEAEDAPAEIDVRLLCYLRIPLS